MRYDAMRVRHNVASSAATEEIFRVVLQTPALFGGNAALEFLLYVVRVCCSRWNRFMRVWDNVGA